MKPNLTETRLRELREERADAERLYDEGLIPAAELNRRLAAIEAELEEQQDEEKE